MGEKTLPKGTLRMCVDEEKNGVYSGRIYTKFRREGFLFQNIGEILLIGEKIFNKAGFPMAFQEKRTFVKKEAEEIRKPKVLVMTDREIKSFTGRIYTADIIVATRRRCGWQGVLLDENEQQERFGSEMQLLRLLQKALKSRNETGNVFA